MDKLPPDEKNFSVPPKESNTAAGEKLNTKQKTTVINEYAKKSKSRWNKIKKLFTGPLMEHFIFNACQFLCGKLHIISEKNATKVYNFFCGDGESTKPKEKIITTYSSPLYNELTKNEQQLFYKIMMLYTQNKSYDKNKTHSFIINRSDQDLEKQHDIIQISFMLPTPSSFNKNAPLPTPDTIAALMQNVEFVKARDQLKYKWYEHYGLEKVGDEIKLKDNLKEKVRDGFYTDHNQLRFSRIVTNLYLCGEKKEAKSLINLLINELAPAVDKISAKKTNFTNDRSMSHW
ncbi:MAG: opioid growth factor receptor-related protein, partial [Endozoicomonadaceae bacterium]|nr:opioid growth factor receptor-related protein [Endozoicomonadaceae bacterium]